MGTPANLPWQIDTHADQTSSVFGLTLEHTTVADALQTLGEDHELGIISDSNDNSGLEIYYSHFKTGPLQAKLIIAVQADQTQLIQMQENASSASFTSSGSRKFLLNENDLQNIRHWPIASLNLIPAASLDEDIILARFGQPSERIRVDENSEHFLYPDRGLEVVLNQEGKELLQYVAPRSFEKLSAPLQQYRTK
jgi:hypothetical protein